jgi:hypothetical protein
MFNTINHAGNKVDISFNSISGTLIKSTEKSKFARFHADSSDAGTFFNEDSPCRGYFDHSGYFKSDCDVIVLQVMLSANDYYLVEFIDVVEKSND